MASVQVTLAGTAAAVIAVFGPGTAAVASEPLPEEETSRFETTAVARDYALTLERDDRPVAGRETTYTITVENRGDRAGPVTIRVSLPPWMAEVVADNDGQLGGGFVEWPVTVAPGDPVTVSLTGIYATLDGDEPTGGPVRLVVTACVLDEDDGGPVVCATDIGELDAPTSAVVRWLAAATVVAATGAAAWRAWRRRGPSTDPGPVPAVS